MGAIFTFNPAPSGDTSIYVRVGVSFISSSQACRSAEQEIPDFNFERVHTQSRDMWNDVLGRIQVETADVPRETVELLYSSVCPFQLTLSKLLTPNPIQVYRTHISPADYTGENPNWRSTEPYFDSLYCNVFLFSRLIGFP